MKRFDWTRLFTAPYKIYTQLLFWCVVYICFIVLKEYPQRLHGASLICLVLQETLELAIPAYTQNLLILPFFKKGKWGIGVVLYIIQAIALIQLLPFVLNAVGMLFRIPDKVDWRNEHIAFSIIAFTVIASMFKLAIDRLIQDKEQREQELRHLKAQLNPHFLFNTLNNLYGLSVTGSPKLPGLMLQLSGLLRYSLYDTNQHYVPVQKELDYISSYVELERIRLSADTDIRLEIRGDFEECYIAPLLLIVFIENCFKHLGGKPAFVHISISKAGDELLMSVKNSSDTDSSVVKSKSGGLGLQNARQRLELIYPNQHTLTIHREPQTFEVLLQIDLS
jgi:two-component system, LytTR family, sensor histidine kinase LytS